SGGRAHRLRRAADEGPRARRGDRGRQARRASLHRPRRAARRLPALAHDRGLLRRAAHARGPPIACVRRSTDRSQRTRPSTHPRHGCCRTTTSPVRSHATDAMTHRSRSSRSARARPPTCAAALLAMSLPGSLYVYQGEELGLPEVEDIPGERKHDPMWLRSGGVDPGRDGCRIPIPWSGDTPPYGFSPDGVRTWLDQPDDWAPLTVESESRDAASMLTLYRVGLRLRKERPWGDGAF